jgi:bifunctional oligoribonuclease and PAP phosphatase NrnA
MEKQYKEFKKSVIKSTNILLLTHKDPDFDAFCSALILKEFLNTHFPNKKVTFKARNQPSQNLPNMQSIEIVERINSEDEDLIIITDSASWHMCVTEKDNIHKSKAKVITIDHHDSAPDTGDFNINNNLSSAVEEVLQLCIQVGGRRFKITESISKLGQIGIISDTGRFLYENVKPSTYEIMAKLTKVFQLDTEDFSYKNSKFPQETLEPLQRYIKNINIIGDMSYTYITKEDIEKLKATKVGVNSAQRHVRDKVIRHMHGVHWGFVLKPFFTKENLWQVSFRSTKEYQMVDKIAEKLGGGGHEYSAAARVKASNVKDAIEQILKAISQVVGDD